MTWAYASGRSLPAPRPAASCARSAAPCTGSSRAHAGRGGAALALIYTLYAGGDDLILIAPWQVMLDFAGELAAAVSAWPGPRVWAAHVERRYHAHGAPNSDSPRRSTRRGAPGRGEGASGKKPLRRPGNHLELGSACADHRPRQTDRGCGGVRRDSESTAAPAAATRRRQHEARAAAASGAVGVSDQPQCSAAWRAGRQLPPLGPGRDAAS